MRRVLVTGGVAAGLAGCAAGAVQAPAPHPPADVAHQCEGLRSKVPQKVHGNARRTTTPASPLVMAWGSPAIVLRCGVQRPPLLKPNSDLVAINGIDWFGFPVDRPVTFTAVGRRIYVEVTVPAAYQPASDVLIELTNAIKAAVPANPDGSR